MTGRVFATHKTMGHSADDKPQLLLCRVFTELPSAQSLGDIEALLPTRLTPADLI